MSCGRKLTVWPTLNSRALCPTTREQKIPRNYLEFLMEDLFSPVLCLNHLFVSVWTQICIPWIITQYCFTYSVAQIVVKVCQRGPPSVDSCIPLTYSGYLTFTLGYIFFSTSLLWQYESVRLTLSVSCLQS